MDGNRAKIHLGNRIFVRVMEDKDIDIRQWHRCGKGSRPSQLGVRLSPENWQKLLEAREHLRNDTHFVERRRRVKKKYPLGNRIYASVTSPIWVVDVRMWHKGEDGVLRPGWKGIRLNFVQWRRLMYYAGEINTAAAADESGTGQKS